MTIFQCLDLWICINLCKNTFGNIYEAHFYLKLYNICNLNGFTAFAFALNCLSISINLIDRLIDLIDWLFRREMRRFGVSVHIIEPGMHNTDIIDSTACAAANQAAWEQAPPLVKQAYGEGFLQASQWNFPVYPAFWLA